MITTTRQPEGRGLGEIGELTIYGGRTLRGLPGAFRYSSEVLRQLSLLVRGSTLFIASMVMFIAIAATNYGYYFLKSAGASDYIGLIPGLAGARLEEPLLFGYAFAAKVGCGLVGEIGAMNVNEELDAYDSEGVTAQRYVVSTRVLAALLYVPIITPIVLLAANVGSFVQSEFVLHAVPAQTFFHFDWGNQAVGDQFFAFMIILLLTAVISLVSCYYGTTVKGGPAGVGSAVARSLVINLVMIHVVLGLGDFIVYGTSLGLPIGG